MSKDMTLVNMSSIYEDSSYLKNMNDSQLGRVCRALIKEENKQRKDKEKERRPRKSHMSI